jgi:hypothetical protein
VLLVILFAYTKRTEGYTLFQTFGTEGIAEGRLRALVWVCGKDEGEYIDGIIGSEFTPSVISQ